MTCYVLNIDALNTDATPNNNNVAVRARMHSPDVDYEEEGLLYFQVRRDLLDCVTPEEQTLLCAALCAIGMEESTLRGDEKDIMTWVKQMYDDFLRDDDEEGITKCEVTVKRLDGTKTTFDWKDRSEVLDMVSHWNTWVTRYALRHQAGVTEYTPRRVHKM
jgi:hypothetical protein